MHSEFLNLTFDLRIYQNHSETRAIAMGSLMERLI